MISWIQRTLQQHFRIIFSLLLVVTIISFVFIYNPSSGIGSDERRSTPRPFFGINLNSAVDTRRITNDAEISVILQVGMMALGEDQLQQYALQRVAALRVADEYRLRSPDAAEFTEYLKARRAFSGMDGKFDANAYAGFRASLKASSASEADVARIIADDWRIDQVQKLLGGPGFVQETEVREQLVRADSKWTVNVATVDYAAFDPKLEPTEAELTKFFQDRIFNYEVPPQVRASVIEFPAAPEMERVTLTDADVRAYYDRNPARFPKPAAEPAAAGAPALTPPATDPAADFAAVELQVRAARRLELAQNAALRKAADLALALDTGRVSREGLDAFLASRNLARKPLPPFSQGAAPLELGASPEIAREGFRLNATRYFSDALKTPTGGAILVWEESLPVRQPAFAEVRERVLADYKDNEKRKRFVELGRTLRTALENRLKAGTAFDAALAAASTDAGLKAEAKTVPPFSRRQPPTDVPSPVLGSLETLEKGQLSDMVVAGDKGYIAHVADKQAPDVTPTSPAYIEAKKSLAGEMAQYTSHAVLNEMVARELARTAPPAAPPAATP